MSQVFIAIDPHKTQSAEAVDQIADNIISSIKNSAPINEQEEILYPGERINKVKKNNLKNGIMIDKDIWDRVTKLQS